MQRYWLTLFAGAKVRFEALGVCKNVELTGLGNNF